MAISAPLVDAVGDDHEHLRLRYSASHRMGKIDILAIRDQAVENAHHLSQGIREALDTNVTTFLDMVPVELVLLPVLQFDLGQKVRWCRFAFRSVEIKTRHERHIDDLASKPSLCVGNLCVIEGAQHIVLVAPPYRDADDFHAGSFGFFNKARCIAASEEFAEQNEDIILAEDVCLWNAPQRNWIFHIVNSFQL
jgi:hypothetical protein